VTQQNGITSGILTAPAGLKSVEVRQTCNDGVNYNHSGRIRRQRRQMSLMPLDGVGSAQLDAGYGTR